MKIGSTTRTGTNHGPSECLVEINAGLRDGIKNTLLGHHLIEHDAGEEKVLLGCLPRHLICPSVVGMIIHTQHLQIGTHIGGTAEVFLKLLKETAREIVGIVPVCQRNTRQSLICIMTAIECLKTFCDNTELPPINDSRRLRRLYRKIPRRNRTEI